MITSCLNNYIGVQGCGNTDSDSGLYLNDLAGIEIKKMDNLANDEQQNFMGLWASIQKRALRKFQRDVRMAFLTKYKLKGVTQSVNIGKIIDTTTLVTASNQYRGMIIELNDVDDEVVYSVLQAIHIQSLKFYATGVDTIDVKVIDLDTEEELFTSSVTTASGWNDLNVNEYFIARRVFVCITADVLDTVKLNIEEFELDNCYKCKAEIKGAVSTLGDVSDIEETPYNTYGLSVVMNVSCAWDTLVCNNKEIFSQALLYCLGIEFVVEWLQSSRINRWTLLDEAKAKWLLSYYTALYKGGTFEEVEYEGELLSTIMQFDVDSNDCCVDCAGLITFQDAYI